MPDTPPDSPTPHFVLYAVLFEAGTVVAAVALGWLFDCPPFQLVRWNLPDLGWGIAASLPLLAVVIAAAEIRLGPLSRLIELLDRVLLPPFGRANWIDLAAISLLAGLGEEMLFRGLIQVPLAARAGGNVGMWVGWIAASLLFGVAHGITATYAVMAALIGFYLGGLWLWTGNLLAPITAHAVYDFLAMLYLLRRQR